MNVYEMKNRVKTLEAVIEDADERIASNPDDVLYVKTQKDKQKAWSKEARMLKAQIKAANVTCHPKCADPKQRRLGEAYGIEHDSTACNCPCHEEI